MLSSLIVLAAAAQLQAQQPETVLGWTVEPPEAIPGEETELDRLSRSPSGSGFESRIYGSRGDDAREPISVTVRALDKITARFSDLVLPIGEVAEFGTLKLLARTCSTTPPEEFPETTVFLEVYAGDRDVAGQRARQAEAEAAEEELPPIMTAQDMAAAEGEEEQDGASIQASIDEALFGEALFKGWMFGSSPSLNALEHPTYDVWVISCRMEEPEI